jgi:hypothetical protein
MSRFVCSICGKSKNVSQLSDRAGVTGREAALNGHDDLICKSCDKDTEHEGARWNPPGADYYRRKYSGVELDRVKLEWLINNGES